MADAGDEWAQARRPLLSREPTRTSRSEPGDLEDLEASRQSVATYKTADLSQLPDPQIFALACVKLAEPMTFSQLFPYINEFVRYLDIADHAKQVGFYSGLLESTYAVFQLMSIPLLAWLSDRIGRRPIVLVSTFFQGLTAFFFGFSTSLPMMLANRAIAGCVSGDTAVSAAMVGEIVGAARNAGSTLAMYSFVWPAGYFLGPLLGGSLSRPAEKYQWLDIEFLRDWPYFLPGCITGLLAICGSLIGFLFLKETLPSKRKRSPSTSQALNAHWRMSSSVSYASAALWEEDEGEAESIDCEAEEMLQNRNSNVNLNNSDSELKSHSVRQILSNPAIIALSGSGFALNLLSRGFEIILVLYSFSPIENGGLSFTSQRIGYLLSTSSLLTLMVQFLFLPYLLRTYNTARMYNATICMFPCIFCLMPLLNVVARAGLNPETGMVGVGATAVIWVCLGLLLGMAALSNLAWVFTIVLTKELSPNAASLGTTNGVLHFFSCVARICGPALTSSMYAISVDSSFMGGFGWVPFMLLISIGGVWQSSKIVSTHRCRTE